MNGWLRNLRRPRPIILLCAALLVVVIAMIPAGLKNQPDNAVAPSWEYGYINGSDGTKNHNNVTARTKDILYLPARSWIKVNDANVTAAVMKYVDGKWDSMITPSLTKRRGRLRFNESTHVTINYSSKGNPTLKDLSIPNEAITVFTPEPDVRLSALTGKTIVWFGTSISAGDNADLQSPYIIGDALGANVYNESVVSSGVRAGNHKNITKEDPMGYGGLHYQSLMRSLSLSSSEKQKIFDEWDKWKNIIPKAP